MDMIEFPAAIRKTYDSIDIGGLCREELICRMYNQETPEKGYIACGICFANVLAITASHTGLTHIAASQGVPLIVIFGSADPVKSKPIVDCSEKLLIVNKGMLCQPCYPHAFAVKCDGELNCINDISIEEVMGHVSVMADRFNCNPTQI